MTAGTIRFNARTHVGRVRKHNEDSILVLGDQNAGLRLIEFSDIPVEAWGNTMGAGLGNI